MGKIICIRIRHDENFVLLSQNRDPNLLQLVCDRAHLVGNMASRVFIFDCYIPATVVANVVI